jgi:hypothetical protein
MVASIIMERQRKRQDGAGRAATAATSRSRNSSARQLRWTGRHPKRGERDRDYRGRRTSVARCNYVVTRTMFDRQAKNPSGSPACRGHRVGVPVVLAIL